MQTWVVIVVLDGYKEDAKQKRQLSSHSRPPPERVRCLFISTSRSLSAPCAMQNTHTNTLWTVFVWVRFSRLYLHQNSKWWKTWYRWWLLWLTEVWGWDGWSFHFYFDASFPPTTCLCRRSAKSTKTSYRNQLHCAGSCLRRRRRRDSSVKEKSISDCEPHKHCILGSFTHMSFCVFLLFVWPEGFSPHEKHCLLPQLFSCCCCCWFWVGFLMHYPLLKRFPKSALEYSYIWAKLAHSTTNLSQGSPSPAAGLSSLSQQQSKTRTSHKFSYFSKTMFAADALHTILILLWQFFFCMDGGTENMAFFIN